MDRAWGIVTGCGSLHAPPGGVELVYSWDDPSGSVTTLSDPALVQAVWETEDKHPQADGEPHRWRHVVPASAIARITFDLGPVAPKADG